MAKAPVWVPSVARPRTEEKRPMTTPAPLPGRETVGKPGTWTITNEYGESVTINGELLGFASTQRPRHMNHPGTPYAPPRTHCSTCRWTEIRIFGTDPDDGKAL